MRWQQLNGLRVAHVGQFVLKVYQDSTERWLVIVQWEPTTISVSFKDAEPAMRIAKRLTRLMLWTALQELEDE